MSVTITDACEHHIPAVAALERQCFSTPWSEHDLRVQLSPEHVFLVAEEAGAVKGYVGMRVVLDEGYISNIAVDPDCRRRGIATALLHELECRAAKLDLAFVTLEVRQSNLPARRLYEEHGFAVCGVLRKHYDNPREDGLVMTLFRDHFENETADPERDQEG